MTSPDIFTPRRFAGLTASARARAADLVGSFVTLMLGVAGVAAMLLVLASSATAHGTGDDHDALVTTNALAGTAVGTTVFAAAFVVASTFAFSVARRRRELALLRAVGATPRQVRRMVLREAALLSLPAGVLGCLLGRSAAPELITWLGEHRLAPAWLTVRQTMWPLYTAFATGVLVAVVGAAVAARQAARVRPVEALRQADLDQPEASRARLIVGAALLIGVFGYLLGTALLTPDEAIHRKHRTVAPMLLIPCVALLAPLLVRHMLRAAAAVTARRAPLVLELARAGAAAAPRRTAATVAPVLMTVALAATLMAGTDTVRAAQIRENEHRVTADLVVDGHAPADELRALPGVSTSTPVPTTVALSPAASKWVELDAYAIDPRTIGDALQLRVTAGAIADLTDDGVVVPDDWERHTVGARIPVRMPDGAEHMLRIVATVEAGASGAPVLLGPRYAPPGAAPATFVRIRSEADRATAEHAVRAAAARYDASVHNGKQWAKARVGGPGDDRRRLAVWFVLGVAMLYGCMAIANTTAMSAADQAPSWRAMRLAGATPAQVRRTAAAEAGLMVVLGTLLGLLATALTLLPLWTALTLLVDAGPLTLPWQAIAAMTGVAAAVAIPAAVLAAHRAIASTRAS
ncbi:FtsX-like permease family protein [Embleya sp. NPDC008237]|uniref:FtsX-like permease family protein n=1 Tax=Embleya sp. NPDC008237 TaxID=3363978 RepID=UPI0036E02C96